MRLSLPPKPRIIQDFPRRCPSRRLKPQHSGNNSPQLFYVLCCQVLLLVFIKICFLQPVLQCASNSTQRLTLHCIPFVLPSLRQCITYHLLHFTRNRWWRCQETSEGWLANKKFKDLSRLLVSPGLFFRFWWFHLPYNPCSTSLHDSPGYLWISFQVLEPRLESEVYEGQWWARMIAQGQLF